MTSLLVTGGTGSFGNAFVRRALELPMTDDDLDCNFLKASALALAGKLPYHYDRIIVYSRDEKKQWDMRRAIKDPDNRLRFFLGDVRDLPRLRAATRGVDTVIHAAALKQVPAGEYNPQEFIKTNVLGAMNVVEAARDNGVRKVLALSTDKATSALNLYGSTKHTAEKLFVAANAEAPDTMFSCVRYGNVTGSRGSVVPLWKETAKAGKPLPLTDDRMTRFWMTLEDAVNFVMNCLDEMTGGQVFIPRLGAYLITDLAQAVAPGLGWVKTGIRPGEKLHESLISEDEGRMAWRWKEGWALVPEPTIDLAVSPPSGAVREADGFSFSSDVAERMGVEELRERLEEA